ncbi:hypothetical protein BHM03_00052357 [Ensete ventricosum]|nr:hypothetical protein BHM03_00052357 [Ensete ventricosum]
MKGHSSWNTRGLRYTDPGGGALLRMATPTRTGTGGSRSHSHLPTITSIKARYRSGANNRAPLRRDAAAAAQQASFPRRAPLGDDDPAAPRPCPCPSPSRLRPCMASHCRHPPDPTKPSSSGIIPAPTDELKTRFEAITSRSGAGFLCERSGHGSRPLIERVGGKRGEGRSAKRSEP